MTKNFDFIRAVYTGCATCTFGLGLVFNALLIWLIVTKTPAPMLIYSKILMAPCLLDIVLAIFTFIVQPIPIVDHGYFGVVQNGLFRNASGIYNYTANVLWFQMLLLFVCCTTIQFVFRYYMIIGDGKIPRKLKYCTSLVLAVLLTAHVLLHYASDYPFARYGPEMAALAKQINAEIGLSEIRFSSFTPARNYLWIFHCAVMLAIFAICYWIILHFSIGTTNYIKKAFDEIAGLENAADVRKNRRMREYNNKITTALIVQAILPTVDVLELGIQTTMPIFFPNIGTIHYMVYASIPLYFIPVLNPIAAMLFIQPYRRAVLKLISDRMPFAFRRLRAVPATSAEQQPATAVDGSKGAIPFKHYHLQTPTNTDPRNSITTTASTSTIMI